MSRIQLAEDFANYVKGALVKHIMNNRRELDDKYHVSDLLAPRFAYYSITNGRLMRSEDVDMFIPGVAFHELLQKALGQDYAEETKEIENIVGTLDLVKPYLVEIKTSRKYTIPEYPEEHYLKQLKYYMVLAEEKVGYIVVVYFVAGRNPWKKKASKLEIVAWEVTMTAEELNDNYNEMLDIRDCLDGSIKERNPNTLPLCEMWRCLSVYKGEITDQCPYYGICKPEGRWPEKMGIKVVEKK